MVNVYFAVAILAEIIGTSALKATAQFTAPGASLLVIVSYSISFYALTLVLETIPLGVTYAIWSGMGIALIALIGALAYGEVPDLPAVIGMLLIIGGVVVINLFSKTVSH